MFRIRCGGHAASCLAPDRRCARRRRPRLSIVLKSTVWVQSNRGSSLATGSGSLIDRRRQLVVTNYHVVGDVESRHRLFPRLPGQPAGRREDVLHSSGRANSGSAAESWPATGEPISR